jgi:hypothetical protein
MLTSMAISPMVTRYRNHDYDGDSLSLLSIQSEQGRNEFKNIFTGNHLKLYFDPDSYLPGLTHEAMYAFWAISDKVKEINSTLEVDPHTIKRFESFAKVSMSIVDDVSIDELATDVYIESVNRYVPLFTALANKAIYQFGVGVKREETEMSIYGIEPASDKHVPNIEEVIVENKVYGSGAYSELFDKILLRSLNNIDFMNRIWKLELFLTQMSSMCQISIPTFDAEDFIITTEKAPKYKKQFITEPVIGYHQNMYLFDEVIMPYLENKKEGNNILYKVFRSGSRLKKVQLMKSVASSGIPTDVYGNATGINVSTSLLEGLSPYEMFKLADGARLALAARESLIPKAGESQRIIMNSLGFLIVDHNNEDCGCTSGFKIKVRDKKHLKSLQHRNTVDGRFINKDDYDLIGQEIEIFSPMTCKATDYKICKKCWGGHLPPKDKKGYSYLGALASSAIVEQLLQSSLRLHHTGGAWQLESLEPEMYELFERSEFGMYERENHDIVSSVWMSESDHDILVNILNKYYEVGEIDVELNIEKEDEIDDKGRKHYLIMPHINLASQDASRILKEFATLVYKRRYKDSSDPTSELIPPTEMYNEVIDKIFEGAYLLSVYVESIISALFFDEDDVNMRYTKKDIFKQVPLKSTINELSPKLNIFYKLSSSNIKNIYEKESADLDHMFFRLTECYK